MLIIVGLGNPGEKYEDTFHNMGYKVLDILADKLGTKCKKADCSALTAVLSKNGEKIVLAKPVTYMNLSGEAVKGLMSKHKAELNDLIVISDDIDLPRFTIRARTSGSGGTHNGMKNIIELLGSGEFKRIRIGVGRGDGDLKDYVLSSIRSEDKPAFNDCFVKAAEGIINYFEHRDFELLMRQLNTKN